MSFYSSLVLAANLKSRTPSREEFIGLFDVVGLLRPDRRDEKFANLVPEITALFYDAQAHAENGLFFTPDTISGSGNIQIMSIHSEQDPYEAAGCCISIHGNGYMWPWNNATVRERVIRSPKLLRLKQEAQQRFGGVFIFPERCQILRDCLIDRDEDGWAWFRCENG